MKSSCEPVSTRILKDVTGLRFDGTRRIMATASVISKSTTSGLVRAEDIITGAEVIITGAEHA